MDGDAGAAMRRLSRRLRQFGRHERPTVAMVLAECNHHAAPRRRVRARTGEEVERKTDQALRGQRPLPQAADRVQQHVSQRFVATVIGVLSPERVSEPVVGRRRMGSSSRRTSLSSRMAEMVERA